MIDNFEISKQSFFVIEILIRFGATKDRLYSDWATKNSGYNIESGTLTSTSKTLKRFCQKEYLTLIFFTLSPSKWDKVHIVTH